MCDVCDVSYVCDVCMRVLYENKPARSFTNTAGDTGMPSKTHCQIISNGHKHHTSYMRIMRWLLIALGWILNPFSPYAPSQDSGSAPGGGGESEASAASGGDSEPSGGLSHIASEILEKLPPDYDLEDAATRYEHPPEIIPPNVPDHIPHQPWPLP